MGFEPTSPYGQRILNPSRMPGSDTRPIESAFKGALAAFSPPVRAFVNSGCECLFYVPVAPLDTDSFYDRMIAPKLY